METNRLRQFCTVCETGNLRKAAELLYMSHSALSKSLKVLQEETGMRLLEPAGRGIVITEEGHHFAQRARSLLEAEKQLLSCRDPAGAVMRVGSFESFSTHLLGMAWNRYFGELPLEIHELTGGQLERAVADGAVDAAITYEPVPARDLEFIALGKVTMGIYHRRGFFKKAVFAELPFVAPLIPAGGVPSVAKGLDGWPEHEEPRWVKYRADLMESGLALVRSGQAAIFIPDFVARSQNRALADEYKLIAREYPPGVRRIERRIFLVVKASRQKEKNIRRLVEMVKGECL